MSLKQIEVTNDLGYDVEHLELVLIAAMFGEVRTFDGIANGAVGLINLDSEREINTNQIDTGDTFVLGDPVYFHTVNKVLEVTGASGNVAVGTCTVVNNGVSVGFRPYKQNLNATGLVVT
jgi:hypothetical protein